MNILKSNNRTRTSYILGRIKPYFDFSNNNLISYVYCKACQQINLDGLEYSEDLLKIVFTGEEFKRIGSMFIDIVKEKEPRKHERFSKKDNSYDFSEILHSFSDSLKHKPQLYFGLLFYACQNKLENVFEKSNPFSQIINSRFMEKFAQTYNLMYFEIIFLCLNLINSKTHLLFHSKMPEQAKLNLFSQFYDEPHIRRKDFLENLNKRFIKLGLFSDDWEVNDFVFSYFSGNTYPFNLQEISAEEFGDCYSMDSIGTENFEDLYVIEKIIKQCHLKKNGCYVTVSNKDEYRTKNFVSYFNRCKDFHTFEILSDSTDFDKNSFLFFLIATSCQLQANSSILLIGPSLLKNFFTEHQENCNTIKIFTNHSKEHNSKVPSKVNYSLFQNIQTPVFMLTNKLEQEESSLLNDNLKIVYKWNLKTPAQNEYQQQFTQFLADRKINFEIINTVVSESNRLKIKPEKWNDVAELASVIDYISESDIKQIIEANFEESKYSNNLRKNTHYSLEALKTTEPVENIVQALKNAEKWQQSEYDSDSGIRILNYGLSGTGKTAFVENAAKMLDKPLKIVRASDILGMYVGETEQNIKNTFEEAAKTNSILLIDEADSFLHGRGDTVNRHNDSKVNEFLVQMERFPGILFCNTNLPDNLDSATDRRFHKKIGFNPLDKNGISLLLKSYFDKFDFSEEQTNEIYNSGDVTPGDFGTLFGQLRFFAPEDLTSDYICEELKKLVKGKKRSWENTHTIGFGA